MKHIDTETLIGWGVPRLRDVIGQALKASNIALSRGTDPEAIASLVMRLTRSEGPVSEPMGDLAELFAPLAGLLADVRAGRTFFSEREKPAPWKNWAKGDLEQGAVEQMRNACRLPVAAGGGLVRMEAEGPFRAKPFVLERQGEILGASAQILNCNLDASISEREKTQLLRAGL